MCAAGRHNCWPQWQEVVVSIPYSETYIYFLGNVPNKWRPLACSYYNGFFFVELPVSGHWLKTAGTSSFNVSNTVTIPPSSGATTNTLCALYITELFS